MVNFTLPPDFGPDWNNQASRLTALRNLGFNPRSILDVGAYHGHWSTLAHWIWPSASLFLIEGSEECIEKLGATGYKFQIAVLADIARPALFNKCKTGCGQGNSLFQENSVFPFEKVEVSTKTLDELVGSKLYDFVKIDCQGAELSIIHGGKRTIDNAEFVLLETQIQDYNEGAPRIIEVINRMNELGFRLYDIVDSHYNSKGMLIQSDLMFAKKESPVFSLKVLS